MAGNNSIQVLRGSQTFDPTTSDEILLDGQPFYSKKNNRFYIGDGERKLNSFIGTAINLPLYNFEKTREEYQLEDPSSTLWSGDNVTGIYTTFAASVNKETNWPTALPAPTHTNYSKHNTIFGNGNSYSGDCNFANGYDVHVGGGHNVVTGYNSTNFGNYSVLLAGNNSHIQATNTNCFVAGGGNRIIGTGKQSQIILGNNNEISGDYVQGTSQIIGNTAIGIDNKISGNRVKIVGDKSQAHGSTQFIFGYNNIANSGNGYNTLIGNYLKTNAWNQYIFGQYNASSNGSTMIFAMGKSDTNRENAMTIDGSNQVRVFKQPIDGNGVLRLADMSNNVLQTIKARDIYASSHIYQENEGLVDGAYPDNTDWSTTKGYVDFWVQESVNGEAEDRKAADNDLSSRISAEESARISADNTKVGLSQIKLNGTSITSGTTINIIT